MGFINKCIMTAAVLAAAGVGAEPDVGRVLQVAPASLVSPEHPERKGAAVLKSMQWLSLRLYFPEDAEYVITAVLKAHHAESPLEMDVLEDNRMIVTHKVEGSTWLTYSVDHTFEAGAHELTFAFLQNPEGGEEPYVAMKDIFLVPLGDSAPCRRLTDQQYQAIRKGTNPDLVLAE